MSDDGDDVDAELPENLAEYRTHWIQRREWAPQIVRYEARPETGEVVVEDADLEDHEWRHEGDPYKCPCGFQTDEETEAAWHPRKAQKFDVAVLERLWNAWGEEHVHVLRKYGDHHRHRSPREVAEANADEHDPDDPVQVADLWAGCYAEAELTEELDAIRHKLEKRDALETIEQRGGVTPTEGGHAE